MSEPVGFPEPAPEPLASSPDAKPKPKGDTFGGAKLHPFAGARRVLASKMGMRLLSAGEDTWLAFQSRGLFDQILSDATLCIWICQQNQNGILRGMANPSGASAEYCKWLDANNFQTYDAALQTAFTELIGPMLTQVKDGSCAIMIAEEPSDVMVGTTKLTGNFEPITDEDGERVGQNITLRNSESAALGIALGQEMTVDGTTFKVTEIDELKEHAIYVVEKCQQPS